MKNLSERTGKPKKGGKVSSVRQRQEREEADSEEFEVDNSEENTEFIRVRLPKQGEVLGIVTQILGADRIMVRCTDGKSRIVRIPGKYRKRLWCRQNDVVAILPWYGLQEDTRADLVYRYNRNQADWLEKNGHVNLD